MYSATLRRQSRVRAVCLIARVAKLLIRCADCLYGYTSAGLGCSQNDFGVGLFVVRWEST